MSIDTTMQSITHFVKCSLVPAVLVAYAHGSAEDTGWTMTPPLYPTGAQMPGQDPSCTTESRRQAGVDVNASRV